MPSRLLWAAFLAVAVRAVVPAGYMPASIMAGGLPFVLCPGGLSGAALFGTDNEVGHHQNDHVQDHGGEQSRTWEFCPFGAVFAAASAITEYETPALSLDRDPPQAAESADIVQSIHPRSWHPRAPPSALSLDV